MRFQGLAIFIFLCFAFSQAKTQDKVDGKRKYGFDTSLKGGYSLVYKTDDTLQYLYLRKGKTLKLLNEEEIYHHTSLLGFVAADFDDYFVLVHTLHIVHQEDPIIFELYEKKGMKVVLRADYITSYGNYILIHGNEPNITDSMKLYNIITKKTESFAFPMENTDDDRLINAIKIKALTPGSMTVTYYTTSDFDIENEKTYQRK